MTSDLVCIGRSRRLPARSRAALRQALSGQNAPGLARAQGAAINLKPKRARPSAGPSVPRFAATSAELDETRPLRSRGPALLTHEKLFVTEAWSAFDEAGGFPSAHASYSAGPGSLGSAYGW